MSPLLASYIVQAAGALFTAVLFGFFSRTYRKPFLLYWARGFSALCIMLFGAGLTISLSSIATPTNTTRLFVAAVTLMAAYTHVVWLLLGTAELASPEWSRRFLRMRHWLFGAAIVGAVGSIALYFGDTDPFGPRFTVRISARSAIIGIAFLIAAAGVVVSRGEWSGRRLGRVFVGGSFALHGLTQLHYVWISLVDRAVISQSNYPLYSGFIDFVLVFTMGLGVVIWLLEEEHTKAQSTTQEIALLAFHDPLTGLPNRKLLLDHLTRAIYQARRDKCNLAVYFIDLDRFKVINDSLGHAAGDRLLVEISERLSKCTRKDDIVARLGGDEFVVLLGNVADRDETALAAMRLLQAIAPATTLAGYECKTTASIGIAIFPDTVKAGFIVGGTRGRGVLSARGANGWSSPAFLTLTGGSFGLQIGGQAADIILVINNQRGLENLVSNQFKIGADASVAAGPVGRDAQAATDIQLRAQILGYSRARGLFAGITINGSTIRQDLDANQRFYGKRLTTKQIVFDGQAGSPDPVGIWRAALDRYAR